MAAANWANQTIWTGDNLNIMRGMNSAAVDLIYLDPPFNSKANYAAPIGSQAAGAEFKDTWTLHDVDIAWLDLIEAKHKRLNKVIQAAMTDSDKSYLIYMAIRLLEMQRILKPTGSIYLHCDPTMSHYLKLLMDALFGRRNFRNEIVWHYGQRTSMLPKNFSRKHDVLLFFAASKATTVNPISQPWERSEFLKRRHDVKIDENGSEYIWADGGQTGTRYKRAVSDVIDAGKPVDSVWNFPILNSAAKERVGYPTQKPVALLRRIVGASSNAGDIVLDPFCGCATACIAAEIEHRQWVGIDIAPKAAELVEIRMERELGLFYEGLHRTDIPKRTDIEPLRRYNAPANKKHLYGEQDGNCNGCGEHFKVRNFTVDHIIPQSKGGTNHLGNLQLLCGHCNSVKGDRGQEYLLAKLAA